MERLFRVFVLAAILLAGLGGTAVGCGTQSRRSPDMEHFSNSIDYANQATRIQNRGGTGNQTISQQDMHNIVENYRKSLVEARLVDTEQLNRDYPGFGTHYRDEFIAGAQLFVDGYERSDNGRLLSGQALLDQWGAWYSANVKAIRNISH